MRRPSLVSRLSSRRSTPGPSSILEQEELRLPVELILHILDLAVSTSTTETSRERLRTSLRLVNRTLAQRFPRLNYHVLALPGGEALPELLKRIKDDPALAEGLEGISLRNLVPYASRKRLQQDWTKLRKAARNLVHVQLGDEEVRPKALDGVPGFVLHAMGGISSLHLLQVEVANVTPPRTLLLRTSAPPPLFPPNLRHLSLSSVHLRGVTTSSVLPVPSQFQLVTLTLTDLNLATLTPDNPLTLSLIRSILETSAPSLRGLYYSHRRNIANAMPEPSILEGLSFPSLRVLSISLADFPSSLFSIAVHLSHLSLTHGDLMRAHRPVPRALHSLAAYKVIEAALLGPNLEAGGGDEAGIFEDRLPAAQALQVLELPVRFAGFMEQELSLFQRAKLKREELVALARGKGVEVRLVNHGDEAPEERFRRTVREVLRERV
ncbi:hypothetical protein JCM11251_005382 [Rhodosporidiobolus azoricus]